MADADTTEAKNYATSVPMQNVPFFLKGSNNLDWGMKNRLSQIFDPTSGRTVMLAFDHGYFLGPTSGLERIDLNIVPLIEYADTLMLDPRNSAYNDPADLHQRYRVTCQWWAKHFERTLGRGDSCQY